MWKISEVKEKGRTAFKANYWICVLVAVIVALVSGGVGGGSGFKSAGSDLSGIFNRDKDKKDSYEKEFERDFDKDFDDYFEDDDYDRDYDDEDRGFFGDKLDPVSGAAAGIAVLLIFAVIFLIVFVISFAFKVFLINPIQLGCNKFFLDNLDEPSGLSPLGTGFTTDYKNVIKVLFFKDLFICLWSLIPIAGIVMMIVKHYEYKMIPYLLAEDPELGKDEAFEMSKEMMHGQKWSAFGLDLSFIGWALLSVLTLGILGVFYVNPYIYSTHAALYDTLKEETGVANA